MEKIKSIYDPNKSIIKGVVVFLLYFILSYSATLPLKLLNVDYANLNINIKQTYLILYNLMIIVIFIFIYRNELKNEFKDFKANYKTYFKGNIKYWLIALAVMYVSNLVIAFIKYQSTGDLGTAANEEAIRQTLKAAPVYTFISAAIFAPIVEELTFRKSLRHILKNKIAFIIISAFIFGGLHVFTDNVTLVDLLYLIPYCAPGVAFAIILVKTDNIFNTISLHLLHNGILMLLQLVMLFRGLL